jgi:uncharacterized protein (TIGR02145 family)
MKIKLLLSVLTLLFSFTVKSFSQVTDKDGNVYKTVIIGTQEWTCENLTAEHYRNGDVIPQVQDFDAWSKLTSGAWCYFENSSENGKMYGKLYNWFAVNDPRGLAPEGWHIPTDAEWTTLINKNGGEKTAGKKLKSKVGWLENTLATNELGFSAIPGGMRDKDGSFYDINKFGCFWSSSESSNVFAWYCFLIYNYADVARFDGAKERGLSVRCVKD